MSRPARLRPWMLGAFAAAFTGLAVVASAPGVQGWERAIFNAVNGWHRAWWPVLWPVMQAGTLVAGPVLGLLAAALGRRRLGVHLAGAGLAAWVLARIAKLIVGRPRPSGLLSDVVLRGGESGGLGYPSGHVTISTALAVLAMSVLPPRWRFAPWLVVLGVALGRVYAGAHLPLDIVGGLLLGGIVGMLARRSLHPLMPATPPASGASARGGRLQ